jgi:hypothetical protein
MKTMSKPGSDAAPTGLGTAGRNLKAAVLADLPRGWEFDSREEAILDLACRQADDLHRLERAIRRDGTMTKGSAGQPVTHPALGEARLGRLAIQRLLQRLEIPAAAEVAKPADQIREAV